MELSRREALGILVSGIVGPVVGIKTVEPKQQIQGELFGQIHCVPPDPSVVCERFVTANSAELMAYYGVFFPQFMTKFRRAAIGAIKESIRLTKARYDGTEYDRNYHRLDALPAVVAAHLVPQTPDEHQDELTSIIADGLDSRDREIREIIIQNLITSTVTDPDSIRFYAVRKEVLDAIERIIDESVDLPSLVSPVCLSVQFLMNARLLLYRKGDDTSEINKLLDHVLSIKAPYAWYPKELIKIHKIVFSPSGSAETPPQSSELLLAKSYNQARMQRYAAHLALVKARNTFEAYYTATGKHPADNEVMSREKAKHAYPKGLAYLKYHEVAQLLPSSYGLDDLSLPREEAQFRNFLSTELNYLLDKDENVAEYEPDKLEYELSECVPFTQYTDRKIADKVLKHNKEEARRVINQIVSRSILGFLSGVAGFRTLYELCRAIFKHASIQGVIEDEDKRSEISKITKEKFEERQNELDGPLDEQEKELGPFVVD